MSERVVHLQKSMRTFKKGRAIIGFGENVMRGKTEEVVQSGVENIDFEKKKAV